LPLVFAVLGSGSHVFDAKAAQGFGVAARSEGGPIVGHDALDRDAVLVEEPQGVEQEAQAGAALLVGQDLRIGQAGMVVDGQVKVFPPDPPGSCSGLCARR